MIMIVGHHKIKVHSLGYLWWVWFVMDLSQINHKSLLPLKKQQLQFGDPLDGGSVLWWIWLRYIANQRVSKTLNLWWPMLKSIINLYRPWAELAVCDGSESDPSQTKPITKKPVEWNLDFAMTNNHKSLVKTLVGTSDFWWMRVKVKPITNRMTLLSANIGQHYQTTCRKGL